MEMVIEMDKSREKSQILLVLSAILLLAVLITPTLGNDVVVNLDSPDPNITSVWNDQTKDSSTSINIKPDTTVEFGVKADQNIDTWHWTNVDSVNSTNTSSNATKYFGSSGGKVEVYGENINGSTNTITWSVTVEEEGGAPGGGGGAPPTQEPVMPITTPAPPIIPSWKIWASIILGASLIGAAAIKALSS